MHMVIVQSSVRLTPLLQTLTPSDIEVITSIRKQASTILMRDIITPSGEDLSPPMIRHILILKPQMV